MNTSIRFSIVAISLVTLAGCASITGESSQSLSVETRSAETEVKGAGCSLTNSKGRWFVSTPGSVVVGKAYDDLIVECSKQGFEAGRATLVSKANAGLFGNIIFGGGVGAIIDHQRGSAYDYPPSVTVSLTASNTTATGSQSSPESQMKSQAGSLDTSAALEKCKELGFSVGTREFGNCVVRLTK